MLFNKKCFALCFCLLSTKGNRIRKNRNQISKAIRKRKRKRKVKEYALEQKVFGFVFLLALNEGKLDPKEQKLAFNSQKDKKKKRKRKKKQKKTKRRKEKRKMKRKRDKKKQDKKKKEKKKFEKLTRTGSDPRCT